jgi:hypothetical protein
MSAPLFNLLKADQQIKSFDLLGGALEAFILLKKSFIKAPLL